MYLFQTPSSRKGYSNFIALAFTLLMSGLLFSGQAFAVSDDGGLLDFSISGSNATITGFTAGTSTTTLTIPATVSITDLSATITYTYSVTSIGDSAFANEGLTSVDIPNSVESIGNSAFFGNQLETVTIPDSVTSIGKYAFEENSLASVTIGNSVTSIGIYAFFTNSLASITIPDSVTSIGVSAFAVNNSLTSVLFKGNYSASFDSSAFDANPSLTTINAYTGSTDWSEKSFSNGATSVPVTLIAPPAPPAPPAPLITDARPTADAGGDITIESSDDFVTVRLDGSASTDKEGAIKKYFWFEVRDGVSYFITDEMSPRITLENGKTYRLRLQARDSVDNTDEDYFTVTLKKLSMPDVPQQSLSRIIRTDGIPTSSNISIGASSDGGETSNTSFTVDDEVTLTAKIYPDSDDVGKEGELYVVMRSTIDGKSVFSALNQNGNWEIWNLSLKSLPAAQYVEYLESVEEVLIYSGALTAGDRAFYVGYSIFPFPFYGWAVTTNLSPFKITVSE